MFIKHSLKLYSSFHISFILIHLLGKGCSLNLLGSDVEAVLVSLIQSDISFCLPDCVLTLKEPHFSFKCCSFSWLWFLIWIKIDDMHSHTHTCSRSSRPRWALATHECVLNSRRVLLVAAVNWHVTAVVAGLVEAASSKDLPFIFYFFCEVIQKSQTHLAPAAHLSFFCWQISLKIIGWHIQFKIYPYSIYMNFTVFDK